LGRVLGILGGSGLYDLPGLQDREELVVTTPFGGPSDAILRGKLGDTTVLFLARHGRGHRIVPHAINYRANVYALKKLGAEQLLAVSAVGSMREEIEPGDFVVVDQFIDWTRSRPTTFFDREGCVVHVSLADPVDPALASAVNDAAKSAGARVHASGTYLCIEGPQFSTRAESHLFRGFGVHVIGMTNAPEYRLAREAELPFASLAMATDFDCWHTAHEAVTVEQVIEVMHKNSELAARTITALASSLPDPHESTASRALDGAVITQSVPPWLVAHVSPLLDRVLATR
jgi:5'-methylthioadenosine phosphorylase